CFGHTNRYFVFAGFFKLLQLLFCCRGEVDTFAAIDLGDKGVEGVDFSSTAEKQLQQLEEADTFAAIDLGDNVFDTLTHTGVGCEHGLDTLSQRSMAAK